jgi:hypothetical protein
MVFDALPLLGEGPLQAVALTNFNRLKLRL